jgi:hypothetical protein
MRFAIPSSRSRPRPSRHPSTSAASAQPYARSHLLDRAARSLPYLLIAVAMLAYVVVVARWL